MDYRETQILSNLLGDWLREHPGIDVIPYDECNKLWAEAHKLYRSETLDNVMTMHMNVVAQQTSQVQDEQVSK